MASKDFMSPKTDKTSSTTTTECDPKVYGVPARPGAAATANASKPEPKPEVKKGIESNAGAGRGFINPPYVQPDNTYSHETNNIVPSGNTTSVTDSFGKINLNTQFIPNVLDNYDSVTYHFKLFITDPETSSTGEVLNTEKQIIIAESGVTDLTIDKVEIRSVASPSVESGTGTQTNFKFEIIEPSGAGMIDKLFYQSVALGIGNWAVMPVYLQMQFKARDPLTSDTDDGSPGSLAALKWLWPIKISRIKANVTHVGTRYEFEGILFNEYAQTNTVFALKHNVVLNGIEKFTDAMAALQEKLNSDELLELISNKSIPDSFKIIVDPKIANYEITPADRNTNSRRNDGFDNDMKNATFQAGTGIDMVINTLLAQTGEYQKLMMNAPTPGADGKPMNAEPSQMKKFWRIITESRPLKFDPRRLDIAKEYTIFVIDYDIGILDQNTFQSAAPPLTIEAQRKRLMTYVEKSILKKKYNYIFTGLNDQVINFDITINNAFAYAQSRFNGIYNNPFLYDKGVVTHDHAQEEAEVTAQVNKAISLINTSKNPNSADVKAAEDEARKKIDASNLDSGVKARYKLLLDKSKPESRMAFISDVQRAGGITNNGELSTSAANAKRLSTPVRERISQQQFNFLSDVNTTSRETKDSYRAFMENASSKMRPIARIETIQDRQIGMGLESSSNTGIQKLSSLFAVALHSAEPGLQNIKITIKGDPFWLVPQPFTDDSETIFNSLRPIDEAIARIKQKNFQKYDAVNVYGSDNFILVRFRTPQRLDDAENFSYDGNTDIETLSGIYKVRFLKSNFENGKFTQELECMLDPEIRILDIADQIEEDAAKKDKPAEPSQLTEKTNIPATAYTKPRIAEAVTDLNGKVVTTVDSAKSKLVSTGTQLASNIPVEIPNVITGGPPKFG